MTTKHTSCILNQLYRIYLKNIQHLFGPWILGKMTQFIHDQTFISEWKLDQLMYDQFTIHMKTRRRMAPERCEDVKIICADVMWRRHMSYVDLMMWRCEDVKMICLDAKMRCRVAGEDTRPASQGCVAGAYFVRRCIGLCAGAPGGFRWWWSSLAPCDAAWLAINRWL